MVVEEDGEIDVIISKELIEKEKSKLAQLKTIQTEKKRIVGQGKSTLEERLESKEATKQTKLQQKKVKVLEKKFRDIKKKQDETDTRIKDFFAKAGRFASNPNDFVTERIFDVLRDNRWIPILGAAIGFGLGIFKLIEKEFADGGQFDLRVKVKDIVRSILGLKNLMDIDAGLIFMSADTRLTTMPPETSSTQSRRDGHVIFNQLTLGYPP